MRSLSSIMTYIEQHTPRGSVPLCGTRSHDRLRMVLVDRIVRQQGVQAPRGRVEKAVRKLLARLSHRDHGDTLRARERTLPDHHRRASDPLRRGYTARG